jgi:glycine C-acetyltransferase
MFGDAVAAGRFARGLLDHGIYAVSFTYPVVPKGKARIRTQMSAAHSRADLEAAAAAFEAVRGAGPDGPG